MCMWEFGGRGLSTTPTTHTTDTNSRGVSAHAPQCGSAATLPSDPFTERKPLSLPPSLDLHQHTHTHTHTHRTLLQAIFPYLSLFSCHETVSLRAVSSTVSKSVCIARCFCYGQASKFSTNIALGRMRETHPTRRNLARAS